MKALRRASGRTVRALAWAALSVAATPLLVLIFVATTSAREAARFLEWLDNV